MILKAPILVEHAVSNVLRSFFHYHCYGVTMALV